MTRVDLPLLAAVERIARRAGEEILAVYAAGFDAATKDDGSPVTAADHRAEAVIVPALQALEAGTPVVAEEAVSQRGAPAVGRRFWLVDPLDGTREFVARNGEFTVNIALVEDGAPVLGVVFAPVLGRLFAGIVGAAGASGPPGVTGAWLDDPAGRRPIQARPAPSEGLTVAVSRSHGDAARTDAWLVRHPVARRVVAGSSLKFGLLAAGEADLYLRLGRTMEWDTAAGHAVLAAAGGRVTDLQGVELRYGKTGFENPEFVARGRP